MIERFLNGLYLQYAYFEKINVLILVIFISILFIFVSESYCFSSCNLGCRNYVNLVLLLCDIFSIKILNCFQKSLINFLFAINTNN